MLYFKTRSKSRIFASRTGHKVKDLGNVVSGSRWGVKVTK